MHVLHHLRSNAVIIACVIVVGLNVWVASQLLDTGRPVEPRVVYVPDHLEGGTLRAVPVPIVPTFATDAVPPETESPRTPSYRSSIVSTAALPKLKLGMTRAEVEQLLGTPPADHIQAVIVNADRITYQTIYELFESNLPLVTRARAKLTDNPESFVALEFDASQPGHPLLGVFYADPLF
jgi:hypothetical protein